MHFKRKERAKQRYFQDERERDILYNNVQKEMCNVCVLYNKNIILNCHKLPKRSSVISLRTKVFV